MSTVVLGSHTGTHVDPPAHYFAGGATVDRLPLDALIGPAWVAALPGNGHVTARDLAAGGIPTGTERLLLRTANSELGRAAPHFDADFVALAADAADWLVQQGVRLVGIDGPSVDPFTSTDAHAHRSLLSAGVVVVEGLALECAQPGLCNLFCLPLKLTDGDGAPARAVLVYDQDE